MNDSVEVSLTEQEIQCLIAILHVDGFHEKKEIPESIRTTRTDMVKTMGRILKKLRKASESQ